MLRFFCKQELHLVGNPKEGEGREYVVLSLSQGFVQLQDMATGQQLCKREANLKLMPTALPPDDSSHALPIPSNQPGAALVQHGAYLEAPG